MTLSEALAELARIGVEEAKLWRSYGPNHVQAIDWRIPERDWPKISMKPSNNFAHWIAARVFAAQMKKLKAIWGECPELVALIVDQPPGAAIVRFLDALAGATDGS